MDTVLISLITSLIVSLITFTLGVKSGKNQSDRQQLKEFYKKMTVHFQELKHGLDSYNPKTWRHFKDSNHNYSPLIKSMVANGDIIEINKKIAIKAEKLEKDALIVGWKFYDKFQELFDIALETIEQYETLNYSNTGNQYKIKKDITGRAYRNYYLGILFNKTLLRKELESLERERDLGLNFRHHEGSKIVYSLLLYPDDFNKIDINDVLLEINEKAIKEIEGLEEILIEFNSLSKRLDDLIKLTAKRTRDPHTFIETVVGAIVDIFRI